MDPTTAPSTTWLDVPYEQKAAAQRGGARWDARRRQWYAPPGREASLARWAARGDLPLVLPGEDRTFGGGTLFVDMVPRSCWFTNVRSCVDATDWDRLRRLVYTRAGDRCEVCDAAPARRAGEYLEAHERWEYDEATFTQRLRRIIALCELCHTVTHYGLAQIRGQAEAARAHLATVNGWTAADVALHLEGTAEDWYRRDQHRWDLDLTLLTGVGITVTPPPDREHRAARGSAWHL